MCYRKTSVPAPQTVPPAGAQALYTASSLKLSALGCGHAHQPTHTQIWTTVHSNTQFGGQTDLPQWELPPPGSAGSTAAVSSHTWSTDASSHTMGCYFCPSSCQVELLAVRSSLPGRNRDCPANSRWMRAEPCRTVHGAVSGLWLAGIQGFNLDDNPQTEIAPKPLRAERFTVRPGSVQEMSNGASSSPPTPARAQPCGQPGPKHSPPKHHQLQASTAAEMGKERGGCTQRPRAWGHSRSPRGPGA